MSERFAVLAPLTVALFVLASVVSTPQAHSETFGTLTITSDTTLTEDHLGHIVIAADDVHLDCNGRFVLQSDGDGVGILVEGRTGVHIQGCHVAGFETGFRLDDSPASTLTQNEAFFNTGNGFLFTASPDSQLVGNIARSNGSSGFTIRMFSSRAELVDNVAKDNNGSGFSIAQSLAMVLRGNTATGSTGSIGFSFTATGNNLLERNVARNNNTGFSLWGSGNTVHQNLASGNATGFGLSSSSDSTLTENTASDNSLSGFGFALARGNTIVGNTTIDNRNGFVLDVNSDGPSNSFSLNNIIGNDFQVLTQADADWYDSVTLEGNFWSDYRGLDNGSGSGKHAVAGDGIGDTRIPHPSEGFDFYPFVEPFDNPFAAVASGDAYQTDEDVALVVPAPGVLSNDSNPVGGPLTAVLENTTSHGVLVLDSEGSFTYDPDLKFCGTDQFRYRADNGFIESDVATVEITVRCLNDPPVADVGGPYPTTEGVSVTLDASSSSDPDGDTLVFAWDLDDDGVFDDATGSTVSFDTVGQDGAFEVAVKVTDPDGLHDMDSTMVTVANAPPSVALGSDAPVVENSTVTVNSIISDPGWLEALTATIDWDDGSAPSALTGTSENDRPDATLTASASHAYGDNGTFMVEVCGSDDDTTTCQSTAITVDNVAPIADFDDDSHILHAGESLTVSGGSADPGSDDLTATWDWGDGSSDATTSLVNPPLLDPFSSPSIQSRDVDWSADHVYTEACLYTLALTVEDDDGGTTSDSADIVVTGNGDVVRGSGWWHNQYREKPPNDFSTSQLLCFLEITKFMSDVFDEVNSPLDSRDDAARVLSVNNKHGAAEELLDGRLLAAWLNFAHGVFDFETMVDTDGDGAVDTSFSDVVQTAEDVRLDPSATESELLAQKNILETILNPDERENGNRR